MTEHKYQVVLEWTGNKGAGTFDYRSYSRSHSIRADGKPEILGSSDSSFRGNGQKYNPEDLF
ncbi:MAG: OsmC family peroxiredoxin, partial [Bacteroidota bacterium]